MSASLQPINETGDLTADSFARRHIGPGPEESAKMLAAIGCASIEQLIDEAVPDSIRGSMEDIGQPLSQDQVLQQLRQIGDENQPGKSMIGCGYYNCLMPPAVQRLILENPSWYTAYTPYQAEISQGRLEMLLNFQTMSAQLAGLPHANASLLDEATAAAEAMTLLQRAHKDGSARRFLVDADLFVQTQAVLRTRAQPLGIEIVRCERDEQFDPAGAFGALLAVPNASGKVSDRSALIGRLAGAGVKTAVCADLLALCLIKSPGAMGAAIAVGSTQRFGVPMGGGGPHAAYMAFADGLQRLVPGRIVGISRDSRGRPALRLALQTREQHIRRAKATSNICTAQVLPAVLAAAYAIHHGPEGLRRIALRTHARACELAGALREAGHRLVADS
ncbi:MAG: glycine dehydrogenase (aminomethyl-transferring), partial [Betaproteobacteria bacterium]|nr:glycine dehydrogenase (aminomethyl-transferring) [Betaproteobacteria bacterium]